MIVPNISPKLSLIILMSSSITI